MYPMHSISRSFLVSTNFSAPVNKVSIPSMFNAEARCCAAHIRYSLSSQLTDDCHTLKIEDSSKPCFHMSARAMKCP